MVHSTLKYFCFCWFETTKIYFSRLNKKQFLRSYSGLRLLFISVIQCEHMRQNTHAHVKAVIYNVNTQTPTHIYHFSTPYTGPPQSVVSTQKSVTSPSPVESSELDSDPMAGWHGWDSDCCCTDGGLQLLLKPALLGETRRFKRMDSGAVVWGTSINSSVLRSKHTHAKNS